MFKDIKVQNYLQEDITFPNSTIYIVLQYMYMVSFIQKYSFKSTYAKADVRYFKGLALTYQLN